MEFQILSTDAANHKRERAFIFACQHGDIGMANKLFDTIDINCFNGKALRVLIENSCGPNSHNIFLALLQHPNIEPNVVDVTSTTALHLAMRHNHHSAVSYLLLHPNLDVNVRNGDGDTPAMVGINYCSLDSLAVLLADDRVELDEDLEHSIGSIVIADVLEQRWHHVWDQQQKMMELIENAKKIKQERNITVLLKEIRDKSDIKSKKLDYNDTAELETRNKNARVKVCFKNGNNILNNNCSKSTIKKDDKPGVKLLKKATTDCFVCDDVLKIGEVKVHLEYRHPKAQFECANCPIKFKNMDILKISEHLKRDHNFITPAADDVDFLIKTKLIWLPENLTYVQCQLCKPNKVLVARDQKLLRSHLQLTHKNVSREDLQHICKNNKYFKFFCRICRHYKKGLHTKSMTSLNALLGHIDIEHSYGTKHIQNNNRPKKGQRQLNYNEPNWLSIEPRELKRKSTNSDDFENVPIKRPFWDHNVIPENNQYSQVQLDQNQQQQKRSFKDQDTITNRDKDARPLQYSNNISKSCGYDGKSWRDYEYDARKSQLSSDAKSWRDHDERATRLSSEENSWRDHDARRSQLSSYAMSWRDHDARKQKSWNDHDSRTSQWSRDVNLWKDHDQDGRMQQGSVIKRSQRDYDARPQESFNTKLIRENESEKSQMNRFKIPERKLDVRTSQENFSTRSQRDYDGRTPQRMEDGHNVANKW